MTDDNKIPEYVLLWARKVANPGDTMVDETGQKWRRGTMTKNVLPPAGTLGRRLVDAAISVQTDTVWDQVKLERIND